VSHTHTLLHAHKISIWFLITAFILTKLFKTLFSNSMTIVSRISEYRISVGLPLHVLGSVNARIVLGRRRISLYQNWGWFKKNYDRNFREKLQLIIPNANTCFRQGCWWGIIKGPTKCVNVNNSMQKLMFYLCLLEKNVSV